MFLFTIPAKIYATMYKMLTSAWKEMRLLLRDWGGLGILFFMPAVLIVTITLIQESTFKAVGEATLSIVYVDQDQGEIGQLVRSQMEENPSLSLVTTFKGQTIDTVLARQLVSDGTYQIALVLPEELSADMEHKVQQNVEKILAQFSVVEADVDTSTAPTWQSRQIGIYFDPAAGQSFRNSVKSQIEKLIANLETRKIYSMFKDQMGIEEELDILDKPLISFEEIIAQKGNDGIIPNAVQHNVPAWILFGIFFIVVPLGINLVKEKNLGTYLRLRCSPVPFWMLMGGKVMAFLVICMIQFAVMLGISYAIFPLLGLIQFDPGHQLPLMSLVALIAGLAAIGLGILIGTIAKTQEQSAPFGAILVIILAALGGVWVPTFIMPSTMQKLSAFSPMNWGLEAFYTLILRNGTWKDITMELSFLLLFFIATMLLAMVYDRKTRMV
jgi:ABC-2 type transport system permease protein